MAYFDSAKNRAVWQQELKTLKAEKERRASVGYVPSAESELTFGVENPHRVRTSYTKLENEEYQVERERAAERQREREILREKRKEKEPVQPEKQHERQL
jgi:hypothetical protein